MNYLRIFLIAAIVYFSLLQTTAANVLISNTQATDNLKTRPNIQVEDDIQKINTLWTEQKQWLRQLLLGRKHQPQEVTRKDQDCWPVLSPPCDDKI